MQTLKKREPTHPATIAGLTTAAAGALAWLWLDEWRWAATGAITMIILTIAGTASERRHRNPAQ